MLPRVSIIAPTYHDWDLLTLCIKALAAQTYPKDRFDVTIVNNDPDDALPEGFWLPENIKIISEKMPGSYAARNAALAIVQGEIIGFTDSDCIPDTHWIENAVAYFAAHPECARIGGRIAIFPKGPVATLAEEYDRIYSFRQRRYVTAWGTCVTANLFTYRRVFDAVGAFNAELMSFGDLEWGSDADKQGFKIHYAPDVVINHPARDMHDLFKKERRTAGGRFKTTPQDYNKIQIYTKFLDEARPRVRGEFKFIRDSSPHLPLSTHFALMALRMRLIFARANEHRRLRLGKSPNRE